MNPSFPNTGQRMMTSLHFRMQHLRPVMLFLRDLFVAVSAFAGALAWLHCDRNGVLMLFIPGAYCAWQIANRGMQPLRVRVAAASLGGALCSVIAAVANDFVHRYEVVPIRSHSLNYIWLGVLFYSSWGAAGGSLLAAVAETVRRKCRLSPK